MGKADKRIKVVISSGNLTISFDGAIEAIDQDKVSRILSIMLEEKKPTHKRSANFLLKMVRW